MKTFVLEVNQSPSPFQGEGDRRFYSRLELLRTGDHSGENPFHLSLQELNTRSQNEI